MIAGRSNGDDFYVIGDRVLVDGYRFASVAYFGELDFSSGDWVGVVLDEATGNHNGKIHGREYFHCAPKHGLFVRPTRVRRIQEPARAYSRPNSPQRNKYPSGRSTQESYYYDEDYRQSEPTIESLERKLRTLERKVSNDVIGRRNAGTQSILKPNNGLVKHTVRQSSAPKVENVFNFRPRRAQLSEFDQDPPYNSNTRSSMTNNKVDLSSKPLKVGDEVSVRTDNGETSGVLRYLGETHFATGVWAGVELDQAEGQSDGAMVGFRYFRCPQNHGLFVPVSRIKSRESDAKDGRFRLNLIRGTIKSPPPASRSSSSQSYSYDSYRSTPSSFSNSESPYSRQIDSPIASPATLLKSSSYLADDDLSKGKPSYRNMSSSSTLSWNDDSKGRFMESDLDAQLDKYIHKKKSNSLSSNGSHEKPKSVMYTFRSSKYGGNPTAVRTVRY